MGLSIVVCVKPVPDPSHYDRITIDPKTKLLVRQGIPTVINPGDKHAIEAALQIRDEIGGTVVSITMAPPEAAETLREVLAMGVDEAYLLSDRAFAGADTLATVRALAAGITKIGHFDLVLTGSESADGGTAHVPSQLGEVLGVGHLTNVREIKWAEDGTLLMKSKIENGFLEVEGRLPLVLGIARDMNTPRYATLMGIVAAQSKRLQVWQCGDLQVGAGCFGLAGSPTQPGELRVLEARREGKVLKEEPGQIAAEIIAIMRAAGVLKA
ncbi:MAG: electron transfer flavoprotein subunit beta/FixA family protein [Firmicutes bacterium]|nr:electron transfer flavoprotein subunit beta/FixA family protein [Bacillota bacterium]